MRNMKWMNAFFFATVILAVGSWPTWAADETTGEAPATETPAEEPDPSTLPGVVVTRPDGNYMAVALEEPKLVFRFFDRQLNPIAPDVDRAAFRVFGPGRDLERYVAIPSDDGMSLQHGRPIRGPYVFKVYVNLLRGESSDAVENYSLSFPKEELPPVSE